MVTDVDGRLRYVGMHDNLFEQGQAFKEFLGAAFKDGKEVLVSELTNYGSVYCILNLLASEEVLIFLFVSGLTNIDSTQIDCSGVQNGRSH